MLRHSLRIRKLLLSAFAIANGQLDEYKEVSQFFPVLNATKH